MGEPVRPRLHRTRRRASTATIALARLALVALESSATHDESRLRGGVDGRSTGALAFFGAFGGLLLCVSLFGQLGEHWSPIHAGLTLMPMVVGMIIGMGAGFALVGRLGRHLLHLGVAIVAAGTVVLA